MGQVTKSILKFFVSLIFALALAAAITFWITGDVSVDLGGEEPPTAFVPEQSTKENSSEDSKSLEEVSKDSNEKLANKTKIKTGDPMGIVKLEKMQFIYLGVENPISVDIPGVDPKSYKLIVEGCRVYGGEGRYSLVADKIGNAKLTVAAEGIKPFSYEFKVVRLPNPVPALGGGPNKSGGTIGKGEFKAQPGIAASYLQHFEFDAKCSMQGFQLKRISKGGNVETVINKGARYTNDAKNLVNKAKPGDTYIYDKVKAICPGDAAGRKLPSIVFLIK